MIRHKICCETRPSGEESCVDCINPCLRDRNKRCFVEVGYDVLFYFLINKHCWLVCACMYSLELMSPWEEMSIVHILFVVYWCPWRDKISLLLLFMLIAVFVRMTVWSLSQNYPSNSNAFFAWMGRCEICVLQVVKLEIRWVLCRRIAWWLHMVAWLWWRWCRVDFFCMEKSCKYNYLCILNLLWPMCYYREWIL